MLVYLQQNCLTFIHLLWVNWTPSPHSIVKFYIISGKVASLFHIFQWFLEREVGYPVTILLCDITDCGKRK